MHVANDNRRTTPSYTIPFLHFALEILLIWVAFSIVEGNANIATWNVYSYIVSSVWFIYTVYKLKQVLIRQTIHRR